VLLTSNRKVMGDRVNGPLLRTLGWLTAGAMSVAAIAMFVTMN
jgi:Mn2+/Fe2+ NRAMP family transporter